MKQLLLLLILTLFTGFSTVSAQIISSYDTVKCDSSFSNSCTNCGEISGIKKGDIFKNFYFNYIPNNNKKRADEKVTFFSEDRDSPYISYQVDGVEVKDFLGNSQWILSNKIKTFYNEDDEGYILNGSGEIPMLLNKTPIIYSPKNNSTIPSVLNYSFRIYNIDKNFDITNHFTETNHQQCIKLISQTKYITKEVHHFTIELLYSKDTNRILNNIGIQVTAKTNDNKVVSDYEGTVVLFSESDKYAIFGEELKENSYTFNTSDKGVKFFKGGVQFSKKGLQDIFVYDISDETDRLMGKTTINIQGDVIYEKIDKKIFQYITKVKKQTLSRQVKIYKNFIQKVDRILGIKKYSKYRKILLYIKNRIQIELQDIQYIILEKGE
ncbi:hypothetical protein LR004_00800 [Candidatus Gracilibacteria bacterium]|nr:hypothetical protein [Candidatus Gracilibacteria bacterium]